VAVRSDRLVLTRRTANATIATVPLGERWILKQVTVERQAGVNTNCALRILALGAGNGFTFFSQTPGAAAPGTLVVANPLFVVARENDTIDCVLGAGSDFTIAVYGARLLL
jgi:hypothetical protein